MHDRIGRLSTGRPALSLGRSRARKSPGSFANEIAYCAAELARRLDHSRTRSHIVRPSSYLAGSYAAELVCGRACTPPGSHAAELVCGRTRTIPCAAALLRPDHAGGALLRHGRVGVVLRPGRAGVLLLRHARREGVLRKGVRYDDVCSCGVRPCAHILMACRHWCICLSLSLENQWWVEGQRYVRSGRHRAARAYEGGTPLRRYPRGQLCPPMASASEGIVRGA